MREMTTKWSTTVAMGRDSAPTRRRLHSLAFSPDGNILASAADDGRIEFWNSETGKMYWIAPSGAVIRQLAYGHDGRYMVTVNGNGTVYVLKVDATVMASQ